MAAGDLFRLVQQELIRRPVLANRTKLPNLAANQNLIVN